MINYPEKAGSGKPLYKSYTRFSTQKSRKRMVAMPNSYIFGPNKGRDWKYSLYRAGRRLPGSRLRAGRCSNKLGLLMRIQRIGGPCGNNEVFMFVDMEESLGSECGRMRTHHYVRTWYNR